MHWWQHGGGGGGVSVLRRGAPELLFSGAAELRSCIAATQRLSSAAGSGGVCSKEGVTFPFAWSQLQVL